MQCGKNVITYHDIILMSEHNSIESPVDFSALTYEEAMSLVDRVEEELVKSGKELADFPVVHRFTPGLYAREIFMPAGSLLTSKIHNTEHPFVISSGKVSVWTREHGVITLSAPHTGITLPGTRRVLFVHEDTTWVTFHLNPDDCKDVDVIGERILADHKNPRIETIVEVLK